LINLKEGDNLLDLGVDGRNLRTLQFCGTFFSRTCYGR